MKQAVASKEAVMVGATSLLAYGRIFFPQVFRQESPEFHEQIAAALFDPAKRYVAVEVYRDGAKTTLLRAFTSQRIAYGLSRTILFVSASQSHSIKSIRWIQSQIEQNKTWAATFKLSKGSKWTDDYIEIHHGVMGHSISLVALGISGQVRGVNIDGYRPDLIICDDTSTDEVSMSPEQRKKEINIVFGALLNSLAPRSESPTAKAIVLDTPKSKFDLIESLETNPEWTFFRFGVFDEDGRSRWEARHPTDEWRAKKENAARQGQIAVWMREQECKVIAEELAAFRFEALRFWDRLPEGCIFLIAIDPASSESKDADDNVVMVVALHGEDTYLVEYHAAKGQNPEQVKAKVIEYAQRYRPIGVVVESVSYQRVLAWYLEKAIQDMRLPLPVYREQDKRRKADRILQAVGGLVAYGHLFVREDQSKFIEQYSEFSPAMEHDDVIDALSMAILWAEKRGLSGWIEGDYYREEDEAPRALDFRHAP